jgi:hypothetical protein
MAAASLGFTGISEIYHTQSERSVDKQLGRRPVVHLRESFWVFDLPIQSNPLLTSLPAQQKIRDKSSFSGTPNVFAGQSGLSFFCQSNAICHNNPATFCHRNQLVNGVEVKVVSQVT